MTYNKKILAVSVLAVLAVVPHANATVTTRGYVDSALAEELDKKQPKGDYVTKADADKAYQAKGTYLTGISNGTDSTAGNVVTAVVASGSTVTTTKGITAEETKNRSTSISGEGTNTNYPTTKAVVDYVGTEVGKVNTALGGYATKGDLTDVKVTGSVTATNGFVKTVTMDATGRIISGTSGTVSSADIAAGAVGTTQLAQGVKDSLAKADTALQSAALNGYATEKFVTDKGYQTAAQVGSIVDGKITDMQIKSDLSTNVTTDAASDTKYPSVKATKTYVDAEVGKATKAAGDVDAKLSGYQQTAQKDTTIGTSPADGHYPETKAVKTYVDAEVGKVNTALGGYATKSDLTDVKVTGSVTATNGFVKTVTMDAAGRVISGTSGTVSSTDIAAGAVGTAQLAQGVKDSLAKADTALQQANLNGYATESFVTGKGYQTASDVDKKLEGYQQTLGNGNATTVADNKVNVTVDDKTIKVGTSGLAAQMGNIEEANTTLPVVGSAIKTYVDNAVAGVTDNDTTYTAGTGLDLDGTTFNIVAGGDKLGGVKNGGNVTIAADGTMNVVAGGDKLGGVKNGGNVTIAADGTMTAPTADVSGKQDTLNDKNVTTTVARTAVGNVVTSVTAADGKITVKTGNVQIPVSSATGTTYASIWVE